MVAIPPPVRRRIADQKAVVLSSDAPAPPSEPSTPPDLEEIARRIAHKADHWRTDMAVTIGQASVLTGLTPAQIRYLEELGIFEVSRMHEHGGSSRLYTLQDLRRLAAVAELLKANYRPAEATTLVQQHAFLIEHGHQDSLPHLLTRESSIITDGFVLARLISQLIDVLQTELQTRSALAVRVRGVLFPLRPLPADLALSYDGIQTYGQHTRAHLSDVLVALHLGQAADTVEPALGIPSVAPLGKNDRTVVFYSHRPQQLPEIGDLCFCLYLPTCHPEHHMLIVLDHADQEQHACPALLEQLTPARQYLINRQLDLIVRLSAPFCETSLLKNYRFRSDGFELELTHESMGQLARMIQETLFRPDDQSLVTILIPNSLDAPALLSILAHHGYDDTSARSFRLELRGDGEGLSGRAYNLREPFVSLHCKTDPRVAFADAEQCQAALAIPLTTTWGIVPFGVLYLAVRAETSTITREQAFMAMLLGSILSELLGRWWLTRLRRAQDAALYQWMDVVLDWFDGVDANSPSLQQALAQLYMLWQHTHTILAKKRRSATDLDPHESLALIVFDIDQYRRQVQQHSNDLFPVRAQQHVKAVIRRVQHEIPVYWFKNDHALIILEHHSFDEAQQRASRIARQVHALPLRLPGNEDVRISLSYQIQTMTYQELHDLDPHASDDPDAFMTRLRSIIDYLRDRAGQRER